MTVYDVTVINSNTSTVRTNRFTSKVLALRAAHDVIRVDPKLYVAVQRIVYTDIFEHEGRKRRSPARIRRKERAQQAIRDAREPGGEGLVP